MSPESLRMTSAKAKASAVGSPALGSSSRTTLGFDV